MKELSEFLKMLGLEDDESKVYVFLLQSGESTVLEISKGVKINRTALYRICERLRENGYLKKIVEANTTKYEAASVDFLRTKIDILDQNIKDIKDSYEDIRSTFDKLSSLKSNKIKVIHYTGREEVKQLIWNSLDAKGVIKSFGYRTLSEAVGPTFNKKWWNESVSRNLVHMLLANPGTLEMKDSQEDAVVRRRYADRAEKIWQARILDPKVLRITQETFIYNDVFAIVQWDKTQVFGVEIYNKAVADQEAAVFDVLWKLAKPVGKAYYKKWYNR